MIRTLNHKSLRYGFAYLLVLFSTPLLASTLSWQGPYVGAYLGGAFQNNDISTNTGSVSETSYFSTAADINAVNHAGSWTNEPNVLIGGGVAGHDWTWKNMVYGVVIDYGALSLSSSNIETELYPNSTDQYSVKTSLRTNWLLTLRGRLGYQTTLYLPSLLYLTGGMSMAHLKVSNHFDDNSAFTGSGVSNSSNNQIGWTAGLGTEFAVQDHVSMNVEYLYVKVPSVKTTGTITNTADGFGIPEQSMTNPFTTRANFHANLVKIGLIYRFDE